MKYLIINADDFGYSKSINKGIIEAQSKGVITSTSLMVYGNASDEVIKLKDLNNFSVGLHLVIDKNVDNIESELNKQIELFKKLYEKEPSHIDLHKIDPTKKNAVIDFLKDYSEKNNIPVRGLGKAKLIKDFFGLNMDGSGKYNQSKISTENLIKVLDNLESEVSEIMCHVGYSDDELKKLSSYNDAREIELKSLTDPKVLNYFKNRKDLKLISWNMIK